MTDKREFRAKCRICGCNDHRSCRIVTQAGQRDCQWERADLCDNPNCLIEAARRLENGLDIVSDAFHFRERASIVRNGR